MDNVKKNLIASLIHQRSGRIMLNENPSQSLGADTLKLVLLDGEIIPKLLYCSICNKVLLKPNGNTSNLRRHWKRHIEYSGSSSAKGESSGSSLGSIDQKSSSQHRTTLNRNQELEQSLNDIQNEKTTDEFWTEGKRMHGTREWQRMIQYLKLRSLRKLRKYCKIQMAGDNEKKAKYIEIYRYIKRELKSRS